MDFGQELVNAAELGDIVRVRELLAEGADANFKTKASTTALLFAGMSGNGALARVLLTAGANPDIRDNGQRTALFYAVVGPLVREREKYRTIWSELSAQTTVEILLAEGANVLLEDVKGETALVWAKRRRDKKPIGTSFSSEPINSQIRQQLDSIVRLLEDAAAGKSDRTH